MGEIADLILEGVFCQGCGIALGAPCGFPRFCRHCESQESFVAPKRTSRMRPHECKVCGKRFKKAVGLAAHCRDVHEKPGEAKNGN